MKPGKGEEISHEKGRGKRRASRQRGRNRPPEGKRSVREKKGGKSLLIKEAGAQIQERPGLILRNVQPKREKDRCGYFDMRQKKGCLKKTSAWQFRSKRGIFLSIQFLKGGGGEVSGGGQAAYDGKRKKICGSAKRSEKTSWETL